MTKICTICKQDLPFDSFHKQSGGRQSLRSYCKKCDSQKKAQWAKDNPERVKLIQKRTRLKQQWGLTLEQYEVMTADGCWVCGSMDNLHIDHDHSCCSGIKTCGKCIRGILCGRHNTALGLVRDSAEELAKMVEYLACNSTRSVVE